MGDLDCPRPRGRLATIVYEKSNKMLQAVVSLFNRIGIVINRIGIIFNRMGMAFNSRADHVPSSPVKSDYLILAYEAGWMFFSAVPHGCIVFAFNEFLGEPNVYLGLFLVASSTINGFMVFYLFYWYRDMPFQLIGANTKFMVEVIPMIIAAALHRLLTLNYAYIAINILMACTGYFYIFVHFLHIAYDIGATDVLLGLVMQVVGYNIGAIDKLLGLVIQVLGYNIGATDELLGIVKALALSFCVGFSFYRYVTYCAPNVPAHRKKELELLPC